MAKKLTRALDQFNPEIDTPVDGTPVEGTSRLAALIVNPPPGPATLRIKADAAAKAEGDAGNTAFTFTVTRSGDLSSAVTVKWAVPNGNLGAGASDFAGGALPSGSISFAAGETVQVITVLVAGDTAVEADEGFGVAIFGATSGAVIVSAFDTAVIVNDDLPSILKIAATSASKAEGNSGTTPFTFTVTRSGDLARVVSADWKVNAGGASASDFAGGVVPSGTVSFAAGETEQVITILVAGDLTIEQNEDFGVLLSAPSANTTIAVGSAIGHIINDDTLSVLSIAAKSASKAEGDSGTTPFTFTVTRSGDLNRAVSADWKVNAGGSSASDFAGGVIPSGTVSFAAGETEQIITVLVAGDLTIEQNEDFGVLLSAPSANTTIANGSAIGHIINDDTLALLSIAATSATKAEGDSGTTPFTFTVTRTGDLNSAVTADWSVNAGSTSPNDFALGVVPSGTVSFAAGETEQIITVLVAGDQKIEQNEDFGVLLSAPSFNTQIVNPNAIGHILNDDHLSILSIAATSASKAEGDSGTTPFTFTVTRSGELNRAVSADWKVLGGNGAAPNDFAGGVLPSGTVSFAVGETAQVITVLVAGDLKIEQTEDFGVLLSAPSFNTTIANPHATGHIINDDTLALLSIAKANAVQPEGDSGTTPFTFTVTRTGGLNRAVTADWDVKGGGFNNAAASDFAGGVLPSGTVSFAIGETVQTITVLVAGDTLPEQNEQFGVLLSAPSPDTDLANAFATGVIVNDDQPSIVSLGPIVVSHDEGDSGTTPYGYIVTRSGDLTRTVSVNWKVSGVAPLPANAADFVGGVLPSGTVTFSPGETSHLISIHVAGDTAVETTEGFTVLLQGPSVGAVIGTALAYGFILNDDRAATISIDPLRARMTEGDTGTTPFTFTVTRGGQLDTAVSAQWNVTGAGPNAADGVDFIGGAFPSGIISFAAGQTSQTLTVDVAGDINFEADNGFAVTLSNPSGGAVIGTGVASGLILNDDQNRIVPVIGVVGPVSGALRFMATGNALVAAASPDGAEGVLGLDLFAFSASDMAVMPSGFGSVVTMEPAAMAGGIAWGHGADPLAVMPRGAGSF